MLKPSKSKTVSSAFRIRNHKVTEQLKIYLGQQQIINYESTPVMSNPNGLLSQKLCHNLNQGHPVNGLL